MPLGPKLAYTAFMAILIPVYWHDYGPTNFLYFCDMALILTLVAIWPERSALLNLHVRGRHPRASNRSGWWIISPELPLASR